MAVAKKKVVQLDETPEVDHQVVQGESVGARSNAVISADVAPMDEMAVAGLLGEFTPFDGDAEAHLHDALNWTCQLDSEARVDMPTGEQVVLLDTCILPGSDAPDPFVDHVLELPAQGASWVAVKGETGARHLLKFTGKTMDRRVSLIIYRSAGADEAVIAGGPVPIPSKATGNSEPVDVYVRCSVQWEAGRPLFTPMEWCRRGHSADEVKAIFALIRQSDRLATIHASDLVLGDRGAVIVSRFQYGVANGFPVYRVDGTRPTDLVEGRKLMQVLSKFSDRAHRGELEDEGFFIEEDPADFETSLEDAF